MLHRAVGIERLALVLGADIASTFEDPSATKLGSCKLIEEIMIGEDKLLHFSGVELGEVRDEAEILLHSYETNAFLIVFRSAFFQICICM